MRKADIGVDGVFILQISKRLVLLLGLVSLFLCWLYHPELPAAEQRDAPQLYQLAVESYNLLQKQPSLKGNPAEWIKCINSFREIAILYPRSPLADKVIFQVAEIYQEMFTEFGDQQYLKEALRCLNTVLHQYPDSPYSEQALLKVADIYYSQLKDEKAAREEYRRFVERFPQSPHSELARERIATLERGSPERRELVVVNNIRHWTGPEYTRVVIDVDDEVQYENKRLFNPDRIYFDLYPAQISPNITGKSFPVKNGFLKRIRIAQHNKEVVRVVLDFASISDYSVFPLYNPNRIVIDILGTGKGREVTPAHLAKVTETPPKSSQPNRSGRYSMARQLGLGVGRIVLDPGHGGRDPGALSSNGLREKEITLDIALRLKRLLEKRIGCEVILTRSTDRFLSLEERTAIANSNEADLFLSIHTNASNNRKLKGIATYFLNFAITPDAEATAARENAISSKNIRKLQELIKKITLNTKIDESQEFATYVQQGMSSFLSNHYKSTNNLGVKQAPFYVLIGANMPSIIVEVAFITNREEEKLLSQPLYRQRLSEAIYKGIVDYINSLG